MAETKKENWNNFWDINQESRFTKASWSKRRIMALLDKYAVKGAKVLDAGCGSGFFSAYFVSKGCQVYSLDYSEKALEITKKLTDGKSAAYLKENLLDPDFAGRNKNSFDLIFTDGLFEHFPEADQIKIMSHFKIMKSARGTITTFVPNKFSWWSIIRPFLMPGIYEIPFTLNRLKKLHTDLTITEAGGLNVLPLPYSPDRLLGSSFGMILYCFGK